jgi:hypothetical protein
LITCFGADGKKNPGSRNNRFTTFGGLLGSNGSFAEGNWRATINTLPVGLAPLRKPLRMTSAGTLVILEAVAVAL